MGQVCGLGRDVAEDGSAASICSSWTNLGKGREMWGGSGEPSGEG